MNREERKEQKREILKGAIQIAIAKDGRTPYKIAQELGIAKGAFYMMRDGKTFPGTERFYRLKEWMNKFGIDLEKMIMVK